MGMDLETRLGDEGLERQKSKKEKGKKTTDVYTEELGQVGRAHSDGVEPTIPRVQNTEPLHSYVQHRLVSRRSWQGSILGL